MHDTGSSAAPIRAMLVDDEPLALANLRALLARDPSVTVVAECGSGEQALADLRVHRPELLFLDVQMPGCEGFEVLERLGPAAPPGLVFVTAHEQYALQAFDAGAVDYLLKPFDTRRFELALARAKERIDRRRRQPADAPSPWVVRNGAEVLLLNPADVDWIEAADYYACLHVGGRRHLVRRSLSDLAATLDPSRFCRVHRSAIVNLARVRGVNHDAEGGAVVVLHDGTALPLSRRLRRELEQRLLGQRT
jgi:two-component system LytT family response regulator